MQTVERDELFCFPACFPGVAADGNYLLTRRSGGLVSRSSLIGDWETPVQPLIYSMPLLSWAFFLFFFSFFSNPVLLDGSSAHTERRLEIAASASPDERCLQGGYQDGGPQSKHLTLTTPPAPYPPRPRRHPPALRVSGSDES